MTSITTVWVSAYTYGGGPGAVPGGRRGPPWFSGGAGGGGGAAGALEPPERERELSRRPRFGVPDKSLRSHPDEPTP